MQRFAGWYVSKLKTHPFTMNGATAFILMSIGDVMAQLIERNPIGDQFLKEPNHHNGNHQQNNDGEKKVSFRRYGTMSPEMRRQQQSRTVQKSAMKRDNSTQQGSNKIVKDSVVALPIPIEAEPQPLDIFRTCTMATWSVGASTPYFIVIYRIFDRLLPHGPTAIPVISRVVLSFVASIPLNATFFCYGTLVHHSAEWLGTIFIEGKVDESEVTSISSLCAIVEKYPFNLEAAFLECRIKLESELLTTLQRGLCLWGPINVVQFMFVPPHLRSLVLSIGSTFWNCYLSLAQHRDASV